MKHFSGKIMSVRKKNNLGNELSYGTQNHKSSPILLRFLSQDDK